MKRSAALAAGIRGRLVARKEKEPPEKLDGYVLLATTLRLVKELKGSEKKLKKQVRSFTCSV